MTDLTLLLSQYLEPQLLVPIIGFLGKNNIYPTDDLLASKLELFKKTNQAAQAEAAFTQLNGSGKALPAEIAELKKSAAAERERATKDLGGLLELVERSAHGDAIEQQKAERRLTVASLVAAGAEKKVPVTRENIQALLPYAKALFDANQYAESIYYLSLFRYLSTTVGSETTYSATHFQADQVLALWGQLAAEILADRWEDALRSLMLMKDVIDARVAAASKPLEVVEMRLWLLHWSLFVFFHAGNKDGRSQLTDLFLSEKNVPVWQSMTPHLLRYVIVAATINNKGKRSGAGSDRRNTNTVMKDVIRIVSQENAFYYHDAVTDLIFALYVSFDFDLAQKKMTECEALLRNDFFLAPFCDEFLENARLFIFEAFCRIHQRVDMDLLAKKLNLVSGSNNANAERVIVNLLREAKIDGKINSKEATILINTTYPNVYQQVIEKTRGLVLRSSVLANNMSSIAAQPQPQQQAQPQTAN